MAFHIYIASHQGGLPSLPLGKIGSDNHDPWSIIRDSLEGTDWEFIGMSEAGFPSKGKRQSDSFLKSNKNSYQEIDVSAVLV